MEQLANVALCLATMSGVRVRNTAPVSSELIEIVIFRKLFAPT